jgi:type I restriction enzyme S subunit
MNVPKGYKMTEVGVIPEDWEVKKLGDIADSQKDWSFTGGPFGSNLKSSDYTQDGVRVIQLQNIGDGEFKNDYEIYTSYKKANELLSCNIYPNDIILSKMGDPVARACIVPSYHDRYLMCSDGIRLAVDQKRFNTYFIYKYINFPLFRAQAENASTGTTRKRISLAELKNLTILCPKISEQRLIARVLSDTDELINALDKLIAKKRDIKKAVMQELLTGKTRLPGFSGKWEVKKLGDLGIFLKGSGVKKNESLSGDLPCIRYGEIYTKYNYYIKEIYSYISHEVASTATKMEKNDILFAGSGETKEEIGNCVAFVHDLEAYAGGDIIILRPYKPYKIDSIFLGYYLNSAPISKQKASKGQGDAVVHISTKALSMIEVKIPSVDEQRSIAQVLSDMDRKITALEQRRDKTKAIKQGMMQALLTGRIRLPKEDTNDA